MADISTGILGERKDEALQFAHLFIAATGLREALEKILYLNHMQGVEDSEYQAAEVEAERVLALSFVENVPTPA